MASFFESKGFARVKNLIMGAGASVVLLGALFKILHWPGATLMLMIGMFTEAFLFLFLGVLPPHKEYHWEKIYPGLDEAPDHVKHKKKGKKGKELAPAMNAPHASMDMGMNGGGGLQGSGVTKELDKMLEDARIEQSLIDRLGDNLRNLGDNIERMSSVADAGAATGEYTESAKQAAVALDEMKVAYQEASQAVGQLTDISDGTQQYHEQVQLVSKNLSALNAVYELELQDTNNHLKAMNKFYGNLSKAMTNLNDSVEDSEVYKQEIGALAKNLRQLNGVYGNMLSAMATGATGK